MAKREKSSGRRAPAERDHVEERGKDEPSEKEARAEQAQNSLPSSVMERHGGIIIPAVLLGLILLAIAAALILD